MKKFLALALLTLFATACTSTETAGTMKKGMTCEQCPCCQKMSEGGMKDGLMKGGMQCPMMNNGANDGKPSSCCEGMMKDGMNMKSSPAPKPTSDADHKAHHPQQ